MLTGKVLMYGGSFDPPHLGHRALCLYALNVLNAEAIWVFPTYHHPFHKKQTAFEHRVRMCQLMFQEEPRIQVREDERKNTSGYTYDLVTYLTVLYPDISFVLAMGADTYQMKDKWYRFSDLSALLPIYVFGRSHISMPHAIDAHLPDISSTQIRTCIQNKQSVHAYVHTDVEAYINQYSLYQL